MENISILENLINELDKLNGSILFNVDSNKIKSLKKERIELITKIDKQCRLTKINLHETTIFNHLIKKYITIQQRYRDTEINIHATQLVMKNPELTMDMAIAKINNGYDTDNILCLVNPKSLTTNDTLNYVTLRHKEIMKLERSIQELNELFISTYAIVENQGKTIDKIANTTTIAKNHIKGAKHELILK